MFDQHPMLLRVKVPLLHFSISALWAEIVLNLLSYVLCDGLSWGFYEDQGKYSQGGKSPQINLFVRSIEIEGEQRAGDPRRLSQLHVHFRRRIAGRYGFYRCLDGGFLNA